MRSARGGGIAPGVETRNTKRRHCWEDLRTAEHSADSLQSVSQPSVTACCVLAFLPYSFLFVLFLTVLFAFSCSLPPLSSPFLCYLFILFCIFMQLNKPNTSSCTLQAPHVLPAHISVNRKQEQAETGSHPRCCLPHLPDCVSV